MREIVYDFKEFKAKVDTSKPIHHNCIGKETGDKYGLLYDIDFYIYGISKSGHIIVFQCRRRLDKIRDVPSEMQGAEGKYWHQIYNELVEKFAKPLGSTEGEWTA